MKDSNYPKLKFLIKPEEDVSIYFRFEREAKAFKNSSKMIENCFFNKHPKIKILKQIKDKKKKREFLERYVKDYYKSHKKEIKNGVKKAGRKWKKVKKNFFSLTDKLFQNYSWPEGKYLGFVTIWGIFPRNIKEKTFQFPYKGKVSEKVEVIIAHEMLHFLFYDYLYKYFPQYKKQKFAYPLWIISEAFNESIMGEPEWQKIFLRQVRPYQETTLVRKKIKTLRKKEKSPKEILEKFLPPVVQKYSKSL